MEATGTIDWHLLERIVSETPMLNSLSKQGMAEIRSMERLGYVHLTSFRVQISAKGLNALTIHSMAAAAPEPLAELEALLAFERETSATLINQVIRLQAEQKAYRSALESIDAMGTYENPITSISRAISDIKTIVAAALAGKS